MILINIDINMNYAVSPYRVIAFLTSGPRFLSKRIDCLEPLAILLQNIDLFTVPPRLTPSPLLFPLCHHTRSHFY